MIVSYSNSLGTDPNLVTIKTAYSDALTLPFPEAETTVESLDRAGNLLKDAHARIVAGHANFRVITDL